MNRTIRHILLPAIVPVLFFEVAALPLTLLGCRVRGLLAVAIALAGVLAGLAAAVRMAKGKKRGEPQAFWWGVSALILAIPAVAVVIMALAH